MNWQYSKLYIAQVYLESSSSGHHFCSRDLEKVSLSGPFESRGRRRALTSTHLSSHLVTSSQVSATSTSNTYCWSEVHHTFRLPLQAAWQPTPIYSSRPSQASPPTAQLPSHFPPTAPPPNSLIAFSLTYRRISRQKSALSLPRHLTDRSPTHRTQLCLT